MLFPHLEGQEVLIKPVYTNAFALSTNLRSARGRAEGKIHSNEYLMQGSARLVTWSVSATHF